MEPTQDEPVVITNAHKPQYGALLTVILVVLALVAGALYVWNERLADRAPEYDPAAEGVRGGVVPEMESSESVEAAVELDGPQPQ